MASQKTKKKPWIIIIALLSGFILILCAFAIIGTVNYFRTFLPSDPLPSIEDSTPGTEMILSETGRETKNGKTIIYYELSTSGISPQNHVSLIIYQLGKEAVTGEVEIDVNGRVVEPRFNKPILLDVHDFVKGERLLVGLLTSDKSTQVFAKILPFPIESTGDSGCKVSVELIDDHGAGFIISGEGFVPLETLLFSSNSEGEVMPGTIDVRENGKFRMFMYPAVIGKFSGIDEILFRGQQCETTIQYEWGPEAMDNYQ